jgi:NTE family protein
MDGGIADNLALRAMLDSMMVFEESERFLPQDVWLRTRRIMLLSVDGEAAADTTWNQQRVVTGLGQVFNAVSGTQIDRYNFETIMLAHQTVSNFAERLKGLRCAHAKEIDGHPCDDVRGFFGHVALSDIKDEATRKRLQAIPTGLTLADEDVDLLIQSGEAAVLGSHAFQSFITSLGQPPN